MLFQKIKTLYRLLFDRKSLYATTPPGIVKELLGDLLPLSPVIVEAGAHRGFDTVFMSYLWPKATIHAFEPVPFLFEELEARTKKHKNVHRYKVGLGKENGTERIYLSEGSSDASSSLLKPKDHLELFPDVKFNESLLIELVTLDDWAQLHQVKKVDLFWLDMQGYELYALKAGINVLQSAKAVYMEVNFKETYEGAPLYEEVKDWMSKQNFNVFHEEMDQYMGNVLFVKNT